MCVVLFCFTLLYSLCKLNHCQSTVIQCIVIVLNDVTSKSREQRLITKEHIATHVNLILLFKPTLYSSTLEIELFESSIKLLLQHCRPVFFYKLRNPHSTPTYKTNALRLVSNVQLVKRLLPCNKRQIQHYLALLSRRASLLRPRPSTVSIANTV